MISSRSSSSSGDESTQLANKGSNQADGSVANQADVTPPTLNCAQKTFGVIYRGTNVIMLGTDGHAMARYYDKELPSGFEFPTEAVALLAVDAGLAMVEAATRWQDPFRHLRKIGKDSVEEIGKGSVLKGAFRETFKKTLPLVPIYGMWVGVSFGRKALFDMALESMNEYLLLGLTYADSPTARAIILYTISKPLWELGQKIIGCCAWPDPNLPPEVNPDTKWFQKLGEQGVRVFWTAASAEFIREFMNTMVGAAVFNHSRYSLGTGIAANGFVFEPVHIATSVPHPLRSRDIPCRSRRAEYRDLDNPIQAPPTSVCRRVSSLSLSFGILCMAYGATMVGTRFATIAIAENSQACQDSQNHTNPEYTVVRRVDMSEWSELKRRNMFAFMEKNNLIFPEMKSLADARQVTMRSDNDCYFDPADLSYEVRIGALFLVGGAFIVLQNLPDVVISAVNKVSEYCGSWFNRGSTAAAGRHSATVQELDDEEVNEHARLTGSKG